ncbi:MAG: general secretion pathway protein GspK [Fretibacterium sp.]|nr:general secretion pathway protein GspK [Fretibacterium sp.]
MRRSSSPRSRGRRGFVLVSVLMLGVLLIACATAFTWFVRTQIRGVLRERVALTNRSMAVLIVDAAIGIIDEVSDRSKGDSPIQDWFKPFLFPADDLGLWAVQVMPLDDKLPIRNLFLPDGNTLRMELRAPWEDMWDALGHRELAVPVLDFMDKDGKARVGGLEREEFLNRPPLDLSELLVMQEITPEIFHGEAGRLGIEKYCTLFSDGKVNLNVAPPEVLELLPGLDDVQVSRLIAYRAEKALGSFEDLQAVPGLSPRTATQLTNLAGFKSRYFSVRIEFLDESPGGTSFQIIFDRTEKKIVRWEES